jgi:hypothetical protein
MKKPKFENLVALSLTNLIESNILAIMQHFANISGSQKLYKPVALFVCVCMIILESVICLNSNFLLSKMQGLCAALRGANMAVGGVKEVEDDIHWDSRPPGTVQTK